MNEPSPAFDLKFLPDWLKEKPSTNRYADYEGDTADRPRRDRDERGAQRGDRRGPRTDRPPDQRGPRPARGDRPRGTRPEAKAQPGASASAPRGVRSEQRPDERRYGTGAPPAAPRSAPAELRIEFLPEPNAAAGIARQIKASGRAYPVFHTAKLFLERPERHSVRIISSKPEAPLFQIGDGPVSFDRATVERGAFRHLFDEYYREETVQGEEIKGNFTNVARCRATGALLGPTNHHGYQPGLRKLYEERFSRRMSFGEFQAQEIEILTAERAVADWKEQARSSTTYTTTKEAEPVVFKSAFDAEQHFRKQYLPQVVKSGAALECTGPASRAAMDRYVSDAVRAGWDRERAFPQGLVNGLRPFFIEAGLHFFKHRKRVLFVSVIRPVRHVEGEVFSDGITSLLRTIEAHPRIKRPELAAKIVGAPQDSPEAASSKAQLASDLRYLIQVGHVIEFSDGSCDLALPLRVDLPPPGKSEAAPASVPLAAEEPGAPAASESGESAHEPAATAEISTPAPEITSTENIEPVPPVPDASDAPGAVETPAGSQREI